MPNERFALLRKVLKMIGLSDEGIDDIIDRIIELLGDGEKKATQVEWPYRLRDDFLTAA